MSRASVAIASVRAEAWRFFVLRRPAHGRDPARQIQSFRPLGRIARYVGARHVLVHRTVPLAVMVLLAVLASFVYRASIREEDRVVAESSSNVEVLASLIADDLDRAAAGRPDGTGAYGARLDRLLNRAARRRGLRVLVGDAAGTVVAAFPPVSVNTTIGDEIGASEPLVVFAEKAGVLRMTLPGGGEALATVRSLPATGGQVAVVQAMDDVLASWREARSRLVLVIGSVGAVLSALAFAYAWQVGRARETEANFQSLRERIDSVLARGRCGLWDWDLSSGHIDWSLSMFELLGMPPRSKALPFAEIDAMIHPDDGGLNALTQVLARNAGGCIDHVFRIRGANGTWVWLRAKAEIVEGNGGSPHLLGIAIDVTETMALEERSAAADLRLRDAIEAISEAFVVWDADNRLVMCNAKFQRFHNLPADSIAAGTPYARVMERGSAPLIQSQVALGERQPLGARTFEAQLGDGRWLQINERRTKDGGYVSVGTDITALKRHEEQLLNSEAQLLGSIADLKKSRKLLTSQAHELAVLAEKYREQKAEAETASRAKSDFLANMSHELRTPLNAILGFSEVMMTEAFGPIGSPVYGEYSRHIHQSGHSLNQMIADVLEMAYLDSGRVRLQKTDFAIGDAVEGAVRSVAEVAAAAKITLQVEPGPAALIRADHNALVKILAILLNNGVKYTPAGGTVRVAATVNNGGLQLSVEDTGIGIPPEALARLGHPFEQADLKLNNGMRGSGLGLAIARSLTELHGGTMRLVSKPHVGTTVIVRLPHDAVAKTPLHLAAVKPQVRAPRPALAAVEKRAATAG